MPPSDAAPPESRCAGSFRDPAGFVFPWHQQIFRALTPPTAADLRPLGDDAQFTQRGLVVGCQFATDAILQAELCAAQAGYTHFVEHPRIAPISYPSAPRPWGTVSHASVRPPRCRHGRGTPANCTGRLGE